MNTCSTKPGDGDGDLIPGLFFFGWRRRTGSTVTTGSRPWGRVSYFLHRNPNQPKAEPAQLEEAPALQLRTAGPANLAYLEQDGIGRVHLYIRGLHYGVDDYVPDSLIGSQSSSPSGTAGEFECKQMLTHYGYHEDGWPTLARLFLLQHTTCQSARRF